MRSRPLPCFAALAIALALIAGARPAGAQASPYIPLDDPRWPLIEHLILRGDIDDPTPFVRPFRRKDLLRVLDAAGLAADAPAGPVARALGDDFRPRDGDGWWSITGRLGGQGFSRARRDLLHPGGSGGVRGYADLGIALAFGPVIAAARAAAENRLKLDPDWKAAPSQRAKSIAYRWVEGYGSVQWKWGNAFFGTMDREWTLPGLSGMALSSQAYPRTDVGLDLGSRTLRFSAVTSQLQDTVQRDGTVVHRYFAAHRATFRPFGGVDVGLWETAMVTARGDRLVGPSLLLPFRLWIFPDQFGEQPANARNVIFGGDLRVRVRRTVRLEGQLAIDDFSPDAGRTKPPNRFAFAAGAAVTLPRGMLFRGLYSMVSSLAYTTLDPFQNFSEQGVGLARGFPDNDQLTVTLGIPVRTRWLVTPELTFFRQGQGRITDSVPGDAPSQAAIPTLFIGTVAKTLRVGLAVSGQSGPLALSAIGGLHRVWNADHVAGRSRTRFEGRLQATLGIGFGGTIRPDDEP
ncbi:MAG: hypothetical protein ACOY71_10220 [Gemmatimonadota bacterium]